jgi:hypothetical protein
MRPALEVADIFRRHGAGYVRPHSRADARAYARMHAARRSGLWAERGQVGARHSAV